jgi:hypothetical protein
MLARDYGFLLHSATRRYPSLAAQRRERPNHTLHATALINEAYLRLPQQDVAWNSGAHLYRYRRNWGALPSYLLALIAIRKAYL